MRAPTSIRPTLVGLAMAVYWVAPQTQASCKDDCSVQFFAGMAVVVNAYIASLGTPESQIVNLGTALSNVQTLLTSGANPISHSNAEGFKTKVNSEHILAEKRATLDIAKERNRTFGAISDDLCFEADTLGGKFTKSPIDIEDRTRSYSRTINREIKTTAFGRRIWQEFDALPQSLASAFAEDVWDDVSWFNTGKLIKAVSQSTWFPAPTPGRDAQSLEYKRLYDEFTAKQDIARQALADHMQRGSINLEGAPATYINEIKSDISVNRLGTNLDDVIALIGENGMSGELKVRTTSLSGDELKRILTMHVAQRNFLMSHNDHMTKSINGLRALSAALEQDEFYEPILENAYRNIN